MKHAHSKRRKHIQSKRNCESTIKGSNSKWEDHADSTQIGRTLYSGMKRESSQSHTSGTVHSNTHLPSRWWSGWRSWCHSCRGSGQDGSHGVSVVVVVVKLEVNVFEISIVNSKCRFTHRIGRQLPPKYQQPAKRPFDT